MDELTRLLADLVAIPSVNPMGRDVAGEQYFEEMVGEFVYHYLARLCVDLERQKVHPHRFNILGFIDVRARETVLVESHLDTVPVDNMSIPPFDPVVKNGKLYGRGSCDTKSSLAALLYSLKKVLASPGKLKRNLFVAAVCDEEYTLSGTRALLKNKPKADYAIVGEPTALEIVNTHKGVVRWKIHTLGKSAHSAYPQRGVNAVYAMAKVLAALEHHNQRLVNGKRHDILGTPTLSVGVIHGGQSVNTVPDRCTIEVDRRTLPSEGPDSVLKQVKDILPKSVRWRMSKPDLFVPGLDGEGSDHVVTHLEEAMRAAGIRPKIGAANYVTDASLYAAKGIPAVVFGPGRIGQAHAEVEYVRLREVEEAARVYEAVFTRA